MVRGNRPNGRNADGSPEVIVIYWRDIPAQVTARHGRRKASVQLSDRFQIAIDKAAVQAGKSRTHEYLEEWRRESSACDEDLTLVVEAAAEEIEVAFPRERLRALIAGGGLDPGNDA